MKRPNQGNIRYFQIIDTNLKAYFLGFIAADGCLQNNGTGALGLSITIHSKDRIIVDKLKTEIGCKNKILHLTTLMTHNHLPKDHVRFSLFNKDFYKDLLKYGLAPRKSLTLPNIIPNIPKKHRKAFILGYFDGDGSVSLPIDCRKPNMNTKRIVIQIRGTEQLLEGIVKELRLKKSRISKTDSIARLVFSDKTTVKKFFKIYQNNNLYLTRKYNKFLERIN